MAKWNWRSLLIFEAIVCIVSLFFSIVASTARQVVVTVPARGGVSIGSNTVLLSLGSFLPAVILFIASKECRSAVFRLRANLGVYIAAALIGFALPFSSYLGAGLAYPLWTSSTLPSLLRIFLLNIFLSPLWEEIIWRAYFYPKVNSMLPRAPAIAVSALGWTVWHTGFIFLLYHSGNRATIVAIFVVELFLGGIILCSFFTLGRNALGPCVLFHTAFNASNTTYFRSYNRINDVGSYIAETVFTLIVAIIVFKIAMRRAGNASLLGGSLSI